MVTGKRPSSDMVDKFSVMAIEYSRLQVHVMQHPQETQSQITVSPVREDMPDSSPPDEEQRSQELSWPGQEGGGQEGGWIHSAIGSRPLACW